MWFLIELYTRMIKHKRHVLERSYLFWGPLINEDKLSNALVISSERITPTQHGTQT